ncbi:MAG: hypothetical protein AMXMBFR33_03290 [Candidatus Xenobia bacterium]
MLGGAPAEDSDLGEELSHQQPELAISQHQGTPCSLNLLKDPKGRRQRFDKHGLHIAHTGRQMVQILAWNGYPLRECPVLASDAQHPALGAVVPQARPAPGTDPAGTVDLGHHPPTLNQADELVARDAPESCITSKQLQIGAADSGQEYIHHDLTLTGNRVRAIRPERERPVLEPQRPQLQTPLPESKHLAGSQGECQNPDQPDQPA